jgi:hypothetical protein
MNRGDSAFRRKDLMGTVIENSFSGALSFMRRKYTRELEGVDVAVTGIPFGLVHFDAHRNFEADSVKLSHLSRRHA